ncbi:transcriptional regulator [Streptomyces sp. LMG1-1-1.1]|uniref:transcriptional regulator n=1 Tax=Streptomyces sp. LMG1-1-1.1 TaxID=3135245 RepID=UPI003466BE9F
MSQSHAGALVPASPVPTGHQAAVGTLAEVPAPRVTAVPVAALLPGESPRSDGLDREHAVRLADVDGPLPPILVRRSDMRVIDGMHRLLAACVRGQETIDVEFFEGSAEDAFLRAVEANTAHGLPLSLADRRAAAERIIASHPQMSDRAIARVSGLGAKTVAGIRLRSTDADPQLNTRVGRDGRVRPLSSAEGRRRAAEVIAEKPNASLREIALIAGISPATASDVRKRLQAGRLPVGGGEAGTSARSGGPRAEASDGPAPTVLRPKDTWVLRAAPAPVALAPAAPTLAPPTPAQLLEKLLRDPSLRLKEEGRHLLRLLQQNAAAEWSGLSSAVPPHRAALVADLAWQYAASWLEFAQELAPARPAVDFRKMQRPGAFRE